MPVKQQERGVMDTSTHKKVNSDCYLQTFTIAVFGDSEVGKTAIILRFLGLDLPNEYTPTIEDCYSKHLSYRNKAFQISIIESSGSYEFPAMRRLAIEKADAFLLIYSAENPASMVKLTRYVDEINEAGQSHKPVTVVSNKRTDGDASTAEPKLVGRHGLRVTTQQFVETEWRFKWQECSATENSEVTGIFHSLLDQDFFCEQVKSQARRARRLSSLMALTKKTISLKRRRTSSIKLMGEVHCTKTSQSTTKKSCTL